MPNKKTTENIKIPKIWLVELLRRAESVDKQVTEMNFFASSVSGLLGYIDGVKDILKYEKNN